MLCLQIMHEAMNVSIAISPEIRMILFLLLNKQELVITSNIVESPSDELSDRIP